MNYLILIIIFLLFYILLKNKGNSKQENFIQENIKKLYSSTDVSDLRNGYNNWIIKNQEDKKTFKKPHSKDYFYHIKNKPHDFSSMLNPILISDFLNQINTYTFSPSEDQTLGGFVAYTEPSAKIVISIDMEEAALKDLYIKYIIYEKTNIEDPLYENYTYYPKKIKEHKYIKKTDITNLFEDKMIAFERPTNLDGQDDGYISTNTFQIERELYLYEGDYKIDFQFMLTNEENLANILEKVNIEISNNFILNETISNVELKKETSTIDKGIEVNTINNYYAKLFLEYKLEEFKNRLILDREHLANEEFINENLTITTDKNNYNYYKLVIVMLIYIYDIYNKLNEETEIEGKEQKEGYYNHFFYDTLRVDGILNEEQIEFLKKVKTKLYLTESELNTREKDFDDIISKATIGDINFKEEYKTLIPKLITELENIEEIKEDITLNSITATLEFKYEFGVPEKTYALLNNVTPAQYVVDTVHSIRDDFNNIFGKNRADLKDVEFQELMNQNLKNRLAILHKYSELYKYENNKGKNEALHKDYEEYKIIHKIKLILSHFIEQLNTGSTDMEDAGKINTLNELSKLNAKNYKFGDYINIDANPNNEIFNPSPIEGFANKNNKKKDNKKEDNNDVNKAINGLNKKLKDIENQRKKINKLKKKSKSNIENFSNMNAHKHTSKGQIRFNKTLNIDNSEWYDNQVNKGLIEDYSFLDTENKEDIIKSLNSVEKSILDSNETIQSLVDRYAEFRPNTMSNKVNASIELAENDLNKATSDANILKYKNREAEQENKIKNVNNKIVELEKIQNRIYDYNKDHYKSIQSLGDGQMLSIENKGNKDYSVIINENCLEYDKNNGVNNTSCQGNNNQLFNIKDIKNDEEYNKILKNNKQPLVTEFSNIRYPFQFINPVNSEQECLSLEGNSIGVTNCLDSKFQRWEALKFNNDCDNINI